MKKLCTIIALMFVITISKAQWIAVNNGLTNLYAKTLAVSGSTIYTGTYGGGVFLSSDNGANWTAVNSGLTNLNITALVVSGTDIFAGTEGGGVFLSSNNGTSWTPVNTGLTNLNVLALGVSGTSIFAGTQSDGVFLSVDNGVSWNPVNTGLPASPLPSVSKFAVSGATIFAGDGSMSGTCGVYQSTDNGSNWAPLNSGIFYLCVQALAANGTNVFAGNSGSVYSSSDSGNNWIAANTGLPASDYVSAFAINDTNIFAGLSGGGAYLSSNNGSSWSDVGAGLPQYKYVASLAISGTTIFAGVMGMGGSGVFKRSLSEMITGIEKEEIHELLFTVAPNPFNSQTTISFRNEQENITINVTDVVGRKIKTLNFTGNKCVIDKGDLEAGLYIIQVINENEQIINKKVIIE